MEVLKLDHKTELKKLEDDCKKLREEAQTSKKQAEDRSRRNEKKLTEDHERQQKAMNDKISKIKADHENELEMRDYECKDKVE